MGRPALTDQEFESAQARICEAALELFETGGREAVTLRALSKALGCSPMQPYRYFPGGKLQILAQVKARAFDQFVAWQEAALAGHPGDDLDFLERYGIEYVRFALENTAAFRIMFELDAIPEGDFPELAEAARRARRPVLAAIARLVEAGALHGDPLQIAKILWASVHGLVTLHLTGQLRENDDIRKLLPFLTRTLRAGILAAATPSSGGGQQSR